MELIMNIAIMTIGFLIGAYAADKVIDMYNKWNEC